MNGGVSIGPSELSITGLDAIVDWVLLEFRDPDSYAVLEQRAMLRQRDGDDEMPDGSSLMVDPHKDRSRSPYVTETTLDAWHPA